jgi:hypothetical protein
MGNRMRIQVVAGICGDSRYLHFVLFGLRLNLALHLERSPLSNSYGYYSAGDRPSCFASFTLIPESLVEYAG